MGLKLARHIKRLHQDRRLSWHGRPARDWKAANHGQACPEQLRRKVQATFARQLFAFCLLPFAFISSPLPFTLYLRRRRAGFTLIEILVALVLLALTLVLLIYPFISATNFLGKGRTRADAQRVAAQAMDTMVRELSQAMQVYPNTSIPTADPSIFAFVLPEPGTFPLRPATTVIRYAQVWRSNLNANPAAGSPISGSWYDKFNPDPNKNRSSRNDNDSRFIARTELPDLSINTDSNSDGTPDCVDRASPTDKQRFIAITPDRSECDVPILRFEWIRAPGSTTPALLKISLTISARDPKTGTPQDMHLERLVEFKNHVN